MKRDFILSLFINQGIEQNIFTSRQDAYEKILSILKTNNISREVKTNLLSDILSNTPDSNIPNIIKAISNSIKNTNDKTINPLSYFQM